MSDSHALDRSEQNQFATIDKWLTLLAVEKPIRADMFRAFGGPQRMHQFVALDYQVSHPWEVFGFEEPPPDCSSCHGTFRAWIDERTALLTKCELEVRVQASSGEELAPIKLEQVFAGYNHDMRFDPHTPFPN